MAFAASDLSDVRKTVEGLLNRFSQSVDMVDCGPVQLQRDNGGRGVSSYTLSLPKAAKAREIRECWKNDRRKMPRAGIVFPEGSILSVLFVWKPPPIPLSHSIIEPHVRIVDEHSLVIGYVSEYSYCFYPNSKLADEIGYFRYDFHVDAMGDGDLGKHGYFHFHRSTQKDFRHETGPLIEFDRVVSGLEAILARDSRAARLLKAFEEGDFQKLALDLTRDGIRQMANELLSKDRKKFPHIKKLELYLDEF